MRTRRRDRGFVLLLVLMVLAIATTILALTARRSCALALRAGQAREELQARWGAAGCRAACLAVAGDVLADAGGEGAPAPRVRAALSLGGLRFHLLIADEQAKANANVLAARAGTIGIAPHLRRLQDGLRHILRARPRPLEDEELQDAPTAPAPTGKEAAVKRKFASFDQLVEFQHPAELVGTDPEAATVADRVTCWGDGRVNLRSAEPAVLRVALAGVLSEGDLARLVALRQERPDLTMADLMKHLKLKAPQAKALAELAGESSACFSLWTVAEGPTRLWHRFDVTVPAQGPAEAPGVSFTW